jgi:4a-hydroxytetrahydrobiopterin dehydratase
MGHVLGSAEISAQLGSLDGWEYRDDALCKRYVFATFSTALGFMQSAASEIDAVDHHPDWTNVYNTVDVRLTTHSAGNRVTAKDFVVASILDRHSAAAGLV